MQRRFNIIEGFFNRYKLLFRNRRNELVPIVRACRLLTGSIISEACLQKH